MKTLRHNHRGFLAIAALAGILLLTGISQSFADDPHHYRHDDRGYWDGHRHYHHFVYYHHHRGYWDEQNGISVFIQL